MKKYTFADYSFQFITVTGGVLIALLIDGLAETKNNRELVAAAHATIVREVADNLKELEGLPKALEASNAEIESCLRFANDVLSKGKSDARSLTLNFSLPSLDSSGWQTADRTGALGHMSYEEVRRYSELYSRQSLFDAQSRKILDLVSATTAVMAGSFDPDKASKPDMARFRDQLMLLQANVVVTGQLGEQLLKAYQKFQPGK